MANHRLQIKELQEKLDASDRAWGEARVAAEDAMTAAKCVEDAMKAGAHPAPEDFQTVQILTQHALLLMLRRESPWKVEREDIEIPQTPEPVDPRTLTPIRDEPRPSGLILPPGVRV